jgi:hypothetical protein
MAANGVSFLARAVVEHLCQEAERSFTTVTQERVNDILDEVRSMGASERDIYAREKLKINTGNSCCS